MQNQESASKKNIPTDVKSLQHAIRWYMLGFALLGGAVGYFAGSSQSPVIGTILPLLFGLIGGASGLYLAKIDLEDTYTRH